MAANEASRACKQDLRQSLDLKNQNRESKTMNQILQSSNHASFPEMNSDMCAYSRKKSTPLSVT